MGEQRTGWKKEKRSRVGQLQAEQNRAQIIGHVLLRTVGIGKILFREYAQVKRSRKLTPVCHFLLLL